MSYWNPNARFEKKREPQAYMRCLFGDMLVPTEFDVLDDIPEEALAEVEKALELLAQYLTDKDVQIFLGMDPRPESRSRSVTDAIREAQALRRLGATLRGIFAGKLTRTVVVGKDVKP